MARFYFIDGSLRSSVGHHDTFARLVLSAVERFGYIPVVAANRHLDEAASVASRWQVEPAFTHSVYDDPALMPAPLSCWDWRERWLRMSKHNRRASQVRAHARDWATLLNRIRPRAGDQFFLATAAELVVCGLAEYLQTASLPDVDWHLLFHFDAIVGQPAFGNQPYRSKKFQSAFGALHEVVPAGRLHWYATTARLAEQYRPAAAPLPVEVIDYPIETPPRIASRTAGGSLQVLYAGEARLEKGFVHLPHVVRQLHHRIERGDLEFAIQANFSFKLPCRRRNLPLVQAREELNSMAAIRLIDEPPSADCYAEMLNSADIGLLPYDAEHYYARCSGVLLEMLVRGIPVVVPANCALADQIHAGQTSAAGLTFERPDEIAPAIAEIADNYGRYADAAKQLGRQITLAHDARRLVAKLLSHQTAWASHAPAHKAHPPKVA